MFALQAPELTDVVVHLTLYHFLWVGAGFWLLAVLIRLLGKRLESRARYLLLLLVLVGLATSPIVIFSWVSNDASRATWFTESAAPGAASTARNQSQADERAAVRVSKSDGIASEMQTDQVKPADAVEAVGVGPRASVPARLVMAVRWLPSLRVLVPTYFAGVIVVLLRLSLSYAGGRRLNRNSMPLEEPDVLGLLGRQATRLGLAVTPAVAVCADIAVPCVVGILRPVLLLPPDLALTLTSRQLAWVLAHELAHIRRYDYLVNFLQRIVEALLFFHPAVWLVSSYVRAERECCCDDAAIEHTTDRVEYAQLLLLMAERLLPAARVAPTSGVHLAVFAVRTQSDAVNRIIRLVKPSEAQRFRLKGSWWSVSASFLISVLILSQGPTAIASLATRTRPIGTVAPKSQLFEAVVTGTPQQVREILAADGNVNGLDRNGWTAMHYAAAAGRADNVQILLARGANPGLRAGPYNRTALHAAVGYSGLGLARTPPHNEQVVKLLATPESCVADSLGFTPLHGAAALGDVGALKVLVAFCHVDDVTRYGDSALSIACRQNHLSAAEFLLQSGASPDLRNARGLTPAQVLALVRCDLAEQAAPIDQQFLAPLLGSTRMTPSLATALGDQDRLASLIRENPQSIDAVDRAFAAYGPPLHVALASSNEAAARLLLEAGANPNAAGSYGDIAANWACMRDTSYELLELLAKYGARFSSRTGSNDNLLHLACRTTHPTAARFLLEQFHADVNEPNSSGDSPLHVVSRFKSSRRDRVLELITLLRKAGASPITRDGNGLTPLGVAAKADNPDAIEALLDFTPHKEMTEEELKLLNAALPRVNENVHAKLVTWISLPHSDPSEASWNSDGSLKAPSP